MPAAVSTPAVTATKTAASRRRNPALLICPLPSAARLPPRWARPSMAYIRGAVHPVPSRSIPRAGRGRLVSAGPVRAAHCGVHRLAHAAGEDRIRLGDPGDSAPDGPARGDVGAFGLVEGRRPDAAAQPGRGGQLGEEPVPAVVGVQLIKLGVQTLQAIAVLTDRRLIQQRMDRAVSSAAPSATSPAARPAVRMPRRGLASAGGQVQCTPCVHNWMISAQSRTEPAPSSTAPSRSGVRSRRVLVTGCSLR